MDRYGRIHVAKVSFMGVALAAALIGKWQLASDGAVWDWVFNVMIGCLVVAEIFEITERRIRLRRGARQDEVNAVNPGHVPPGWQWDPARSTWRPPDT